MELVFFNKRKAGKVALLQLGEASGIETGMENNLGRGA